jgi:hypothetical protein
MRKICIGVRLTLDEKETVLQYDAVDKKWTIDTTVLRHYNKAKRQGWTQLVEYVYDDGSVCGGVFEAPDYAVTIRSTTKKQMSDKQMLNLG